MAQETLLPVGHFYVAPFWLCPVESKFFTKSLNNHLRLKLFFFSKSLSSRDLFIAIYNKIHFPIGNFKVHSPQNKNLTKCPLIITPDQNYFHQNHGLEETFLVIGYKTLFPIKKFKVVPPSPLESKFNLINHQIIIPGHISM